MSFGFNFRGTSAFTIDAGDETCALVSTTGGATDSFPTVRNGQTFGFDLTNASGNDEDATLDRRLAGYLNQDNNGLLSRFNWVLPDGGGDYDLSLAMGNQFWYQPQMQFDLYDQDQIIYTYNINQPTPNGYYRDAQLNLWTAKEWPLYNRPLRIRVLGLFRIRCGVPGGGSGSSIINHLRMTLVAAANPPTNQLYTGSGLVQFLSANTKPLPFVFVPSAISVRTYVPTGGLAWGGSAATSAFLSALKIYLPTGVFRFAGAANTVTSAPPARRPRATTVPWDGQMTTKGITI